MSYLDKLLAGRPVTWKPLGDVAEIKRGKRVVRKDLMAKGSYAVFQNSLTPLGFFDKWNVSQNSCFVVAAGAAGEIGYSRENFWAADDIYYFGSSGNLIDRYLYHFLLSSKFKITSKVRKASIPRLSRSVLERLEIPIPPRDVQEEIVRVLDRFTELEAELEAELETELEARQKQYAYYRDLLLSFPDDAVTYLPLGDVVDIRRGKRVVRKDLAEEGSYAVFQNSLTPLGYFDKWNVPKDSCFVVAAGAAGEIGYSRENFWAADDIYYFESSGNLIDRYLYHFLLSSKHMITSKVRKASIPRLSRIALERLPIPIPPLEEQERIVGILDRFETLAHSITEGLPRELELRRMQYSYYRDLLLTFTPQD
ncbi:restriction endonuclease subunit S [Porphyromonas bennonis]|uniref:restriction endonuclease subunit S n=1 Tax=Porphyromonas bennonis TaxID=501496 RepID=UPI00037ED02D|nr:restriction endonuclease subunit S [Porphyromonas bennonis]